MVATAASASCVGVVVGFVASEGSRPQHSAASLAANAQVCKGPPIKPTAGDSGSTGVGPSMARLAKPLPSWPSAPMPQQRTPVCAVNKQVLVAPQAKCERRALVGRAPPSAPLAASSSPVPPAPTEVRTLPPQARQIALAASAASVCVSNPLTWFAAQLA